MASTDDEIWGALFPGETFHAVYFLRRAIDLEGRYRHLAISGE